MDYELGHFCAPANVYPVVGEALKADFSGVDLKDWIGVNDFPLGSSANAMAKKAEAITGFRARLAADAERYEDIRINGEAALSRYDVEIAASGSADRAVSTAMALKYNHLMYGLRCIEAARQLAPGLVAFIESGAASEPSQIIADVHEESAQLALF